MSIEIKVPFPKCEGMEVKKVTADIEKGYSVVEYGEKEKKDILVPDNIGIFQLPSSAYCSNYGDNLLIAFNEDKLLLAYCNEAYCVEPRSKCFIHKVKCKLTPCKREDLKAGDTAVIYQKNIPNPDLTMISRYYKVLPNDKYAKVDGESISVVTIEGKYLFFKVEPIQ